MICGVGLMAGQTLLEAQGQEPGKGTQATPEQVAPVQEKEGTKEAERPLLPMGPAPIQALVSLDSEGNVVVRSLESPRLNIEMMRQLELMAAQGVPIGNQNFAPQITTKRYQLQEVQVFDMAIKAIDPKALPKLLPKESPALIVRGRQPLDSLHFRLYKEGTLLFVLPAQPAAGGVQPGANGQPPVRDNNGTR